MALCNKILIAVRIGIIPEISVNDFNLMPTFSIPYTVYPGKFIRTHSIRSQNISAKIVFLAWIKY